MEADQHAFFLRVIAREDTHVDEPAGAQDPHTVTGRLDLTEEVRGEERGLPAGGSVRLSLERSNGHHAVTVSDTGAGIPAEAQQKIFERFYRVDKARSRAEAAQGATSGAGLGLAIARRIAEAHGGQLVLKNSGEAGSTFVASLPVNCEF